MHGEAINNNRMTLNSCKIAQSLYQNQNCDSLVITESSIDGDVDIISMCTDVGLNLRVKWRYDQRPGQTIPNLC